MEKKIKQDMEKDLIEEKDIKNKNSITIGENNVGNTNHESDNNVYENNSLSNAINVKHKREVIY
jgi:hypothetical protein